FGERVLYAAQLFISCKHRHAEQFYLAPGIIDVEFFFYRIAGFAQEIRQRSPQGGPSAMAQMHGAGRVGAYKFYLYFPASADILGKECLSRGNERLQFFIQEQS